jgi:hypothetical protein
MPGPPRSTATWQIRLHAAGYTAQASSTPASDESTTMHHYDPEHAPNATSWLALDEMERIVLVEKCHRKARIELPNVRLHAMIHAVVETQIAENHEPVVRAMSRRTSAGLSRHDALHAIGSLLAEHIFEQLRDDAADGDPMAAYDAAVERLSAQGWLRQNGFPPSRE